uniref:ING domain-containing protein n=1 Tax=Haemonchus placei TaxID=6290 RepID=A0A0N4XBR0_HAEPC
LSQLSNITMDVYDDENLELYKENLQECECRLRSLDKKFDELSASDRKAELEAIFALHKSIRFGSLLLPEVKTWTTNNNTLNKLLSRCYAEEEALLNDANKSNTGNSNVAKEADVNNNSVEQEAEDNRSAVDNGEAAENHKTVDNEKRSAGDGGITPEMKRRKHLKKEMSHNYFGKEAAIIWKPGFYRICFKFNNLLRNCGLLLSDWCNAKRYVEPPYLVDVPNKSSLPGPRKSLRFFICGLPGQAL